jgi:hypothetical protein
LDVDGLGDSDSLLTAKVTLRLEIARINTQALIHRTSAGRATRNKGSAA